MAMKEHRWITNVRVPCKVQRNEDGDIFVRVDANKEVFDYVAQIWCYDCEQPYQEIFGTPCAGFMATGEKDETMSDKAWEGIL